MRNNLEELRKECGINQEELADALEVSRQTIGSLENGDITHLLFWHLKLHDISESQLKRFLYMRGSAHENIK